MTTKLIVLGANLSDSYRAGSIRVRNLLDSIAGNDDYSILNLLYQGEIVSNCKLASNVSIHSQVGFFKYIKLLILFVKLKHKNKHVIIYNYGSIVPSNFLLFIWAKLIQIPVIFDIVENHHLRIGEKPMLVKFKYFFRRYFEKRLYLFASKAFVISSKLEKLVNGFAENRFPVVYLPISVRLSEWEHEQIESNKEEKIIFYGGSFGPKDGLEYLLEAFQNISSDFPCVDLRLSGSGAIRNINVIKNKIDELECKHRISFLGALSRNDYIQNVNGSDILCMTRNNSEYANYGFPFKIGEYLAAGKAIIASNVSDISKYLEHKKDVWLTTPGSVVEIEEGLRCLLRDTDLRKNLGLNARLKAKIHFDSLVIGKQFKQNLDETFGKRMKMPSKQGH